MGDLTVAQRGCGRVPRVRIPSDTLERAQTPRRDCMPLGVLLPYCFHQRRDAGNWDAKSLTLGGVDVASVSLATDSPSVPILFDDLHPEHNVLVGQPRRLVARSVIPG